MKPLISKTIESSSILNTLNRKNNPLGRISILGGSSITPLEKKHHRQLGYYIGEQGIEIITGAGSGTMEVPFEGVSMAYKNNHYNNKNLIGLTEENILKHEQINPHCNTIILFPTREKRMEAFIKLSKAIIILPGGIGTFEEIIMWLLIKLDLKNKNNMIYPLYFIEPEEIYYFEKIFKFLSLIIKKNILDIENIHYFKTSINSKNKHLTLSSCFKNIHQTMKSKNNYIHNNLWNNNIYIPIELNKKMTLTQECFDEINLNLDQPIKKLLWDTKKICYLIIEQTLNKKKQTPLLIKGNKEIMIELDSLIRFLIKEKRLNLTHKPYIY